MLFTDEDKICLLSLSRIDFFPPNLNSADRAKYTVKLSFTVLFCFGGHSFLDQGSNGNRLCLVFLDQGTKLLSFGYYG